MKQASLGEFQHKVLRCALGGEAIAVTCDDRILGYFVPTPYHDEAETRLAVAELGAAVDRIKADTGMSEDELADLFDLAKPFA